MTIPFIGHLREREGFGRRLDDLVADIGGVVLLAGTQNVASDIVSARHIPAETVWPTDRFVKP